MHSKLQELTDKIYQEGVEKGNAEAQQLIDKAKSEASQIIDQAKKEAESIIEAAKKKAGETKKNTESELKLSGKQAINALKQQITDLITGEISQVAVENAFGKDFTKHIIEITLANWAKSGQSMDLKVLLPAKDEKDLTGYFNKEAKEYLDKGLKFQYDPAIKAGFQIGPRDGSYKVSFTDEDFINFFKQHLRPKLVEILFGTE
jgi:V/A-type H+-transporting ATPase subunit E